ncbi:MAG TPA: hypothetical protein VF509_02470 [Sphingobium sp.]
MKRRALVLTSESARHPFRQTLPPHVLAPLAKSKARDDDQDFKLFLLSFVAFFTAFYGFIA